MKQVWLAPMAGITDLPFRLLCREQGCDFAFTEMISAKGLLLSPRARASQQLRSALPGENVGAQVFGAEPETVAEASAQLAETGRYRLIDINMGCPAPKIVNGGEGAALLKDIDLAERILRATVRAVAPLPVSVKIRLGWKTPVHLEFGRMAEAAGAAFITLHGRTRQQFYGEHASWEAVRELREALRIPVIANGDVRDADSARECLRVTGCDTVMIGRAAQGNPWVFAEIRAAFEGRAWSPPGLIERCDMALRHAAMLAAFKGETVGVKEMRKHCAWYLKGFRGSAEARVRINGARTLAELRSILLALREMADTL